MNCVKRLTPLTGGVSKGGDLHRYSYPQTGSQIAIANRSLSTMPEGWKPFYEDPGIHDVPLSLREALEEAVRCGRPMSWAVLSSLGCSDPIKRCARAVLSLMVPAVTMVEIYNSRLESTFACFYRSRLLCYAIQPSLHYGLQAWQVGGRGGLPSGLYDIVPYYWKDKRKHVWALEGDPRRGGILFHSGSSVADSKGCVLVGNVTGGSVTRLTQSRLATSILWAAFKVGAVDHYLSDGQPAPRSEHPSCLILRKNTYYGL